MRGRRLLVGALAALWSISADIGAASAGAQPAGVATPVEQVRVEPGKARLVRLPRPAAAVFVADPAVADIQVRSPTLVYLFGKRPGATNLLALDGREQVITDLTIAVGPDTEAVAAALRRQAPGAAVEVDAVGDALVLSGRVRSASEGADLARIAARFLNGDGQAERVINRMSVDAPNQVLLRVRIAEASRTARRMLGFNWDSFGELGETLVGVGTGRPILADGARDTFLRRNDADSLAGRYRRGTTDLNVLVDLLDERGLVKVLAEPNLTAVSGEPASFLAGGEYPIPVPQQGESQITVDYKQFGVSLAFVATVLDGGRISLNVRPEVSQLSDAGAVNLDGVRIPALTTRRAETTVELGSGQSFAIAGLLQRSDRNAIRRTPGLGDVPILGELFRSREFQNDESELVIIVTPYLVRPSSEPLATPLDRRPTDRAPGGRAKPGSRR